MKKWLSNPRPQLQSTIMSSFVESASSLNLQVEDLRLEEMEGRDESMEPEDPASMPTTPPLSGFADGIPNLKKPDGIPTGSHSGSRDPRDLNFKVSKDLCACKQ